MAARKQPRRNRTLAAREALVQRLKRVFDFVRATYGTRAQRLGPADDMSRGKSVTRQRYRYFEQWVFLNNENGDPIAAAEIAFALEDLADIDKEAWHALLMIRIVERAYDRLDKQISTERMLSDEHPEVMEGLPDYPAPPVDRSLSMEAVRATPIGEAYGLPPRPTRPGPKPRDRNEGALLEWAIGVCLEHGYRATRRKKSKTAVCGCSLVSEASGVAEDTIARVWHAYRKGKGSDYWLDYCGGLFERVRERTGYFPWEFKPAGTDDDGADGT